MSGLLDFAIQFVLLLTLGDAATERSAAGWGLLLTPVFLVLCAVAALSVGFWLRR